MTYENLMAKIGLGLVVVNYLDRKVITVPLVPQHLQTGQGQEIMQLLGTLMEYFGYLGVKVSTLMEI